MKRYSGKERRVVTEGYGIIQPRIGTGLIDKRKNRFTTIYSEEGGVDSYANAISDVYQDNFGEGIFTGKGIYDLQIFHEVMCKEIPENTVLSHDLLEGSYLRCALATDILLLDSSPTKYISHSNRMSRWIRGDWQIARWLGRKSPLGRLSKFKILDNLRKSLVPIFATILTFISVSFLLGLNYNAGRFDLRSFKFQTLLLGISLVAISAPFILDILNIIIFKKEEGSAVISARKNITQTMSGIKASLTRACLDIVFLPTKMMISLIAITKSVYRMLVSKKKLLEWMTSEEAERQSKEVLSSHFRFMWPNIILGTILLFISGRLFVKLVNYSVPGVFLGVWSRSTIFYLTEFRSLVADCSSVCMAY